MIDIRVYAGNKATFRFEDYCDCNYCDCYDFYCMDDKDVETAYSALAESINLRNPERDCTDFQNLRDDSVKTLLEDAERQEFISDYEIEQL